MKQTLCDILDHNYAVQTPVTACYAEATVQHKIGIELYKRLGVESVLERKVPGRNEYMDVYSEADGIRYGVELKYKTRRHANTSFEYTSQGAQNNGRYDYIWDVYRLETYKSAGLIDVGYAIFLTNDPSYWTQCRQGTGVAAFDLSSGRSLAGIYHPMWIGRTKTIKLTGNYPLSWSTPTASLPTGAEGFRYCIIEI